MSQAKNIYDYLARSENRSVDQALLLAWRRAEEPYRTALLEAILTRGKSNTTLRLIEQFHLLSPQTQQLLTERVKSLYGGLYLGARATSPQTKQNTLTIICRSGYLLLTEMVSSMLRDRDKKISQRAGEVLLSLSNGFAWKNSGDSLGDECEHPAASKRPLQETHVNKRLMVSALNKALRDFEAHHRVEAILAAMQAISADQRSFWRDRLEGYHVIGKMVRQVLLTYDRPDIVPFCVSGLANVSLRGTAAQAISTHQRPDYLGRVAMEVSRQSNRAVLLGLKLVRDPRWLVPDQFKPDGMPQRAQEAMVSLVRRLHRTDQEKAAYLVAIAEKGVDSAGRKSIVALSRMEKEIARKSLERLVQSGSETIGIVAVEQMRKKKWPQFHQIMLEQFSHGSGKLHELARRYLQEMAFDRYWETFDRLPSGRRLAGGRAVYKIDPQAHVRWRKKARDHSAIQRLRAVRLARLLGCVDDYMDELLELAHDRDQKVRSCAIAGLGESQQGHEKITTLLVGALCDADSRVRANAIESLERIAPREKAHDISQCIQDKNNRVQANAIKALLHWKVASAKQAIDRMLSDPRPKHRISAQWAANQTDINENGGKKSLDPEQDIPRIPVAVHSS